MNRAELLYWAAKIHLVTLQRNGDACPDLSTREAARLIRAVDKRARMTRSQADYFDGVIPRESKTRQKQPRKK